MLVIKVYITKRVPIRDGESVDKGKTHHTELKLIDEIHIQNVGQIAGDIWKYKIKKPRGVAAQMTHSRSDGYRPLLERALALLGHKGKKEYKRRRK